MVKKLELNQNISNIIHIFFDGNLSNLDLDKLKIIYNDPSQNINDMISSNDYKSLKTIIKYLKNPKADIRIILKEKDINITETKTKKKSKTKQYPIVNTITKKKEESPLFITSQRKAFVKWINDVFYPNILKLSDDSILKSYQYFIKEYLSLETPYRGVLVYHGLGTGKTASAISAAEGLSKNIPITTMLPASLEIEFIKEVKLWGDQFFKIDKNNWVFYDINEFKKNKELRTNIFKLYQISLDVITQIYNIIKRKTKDKDIEEGFWVYSEDIESDKERIKTISGNLVGNEKIKVKKLTENDKIYINEQISVMISKKYNFIHYNPFPKLEVEKKESGNYTDNQMISLRLQEKLKKNKKLGINSPFKDEVIIIDEVHNLVREIYNNSGPSRTYYDWIINSVDCKIIFLSGTPIINKPSEIAILFNMLKGIIKLHTFVVNDNRGLDELNDKLKTLFYTNYSPVKQFLIKKIKGKYVITFIKNTSNFESIMKDNNIIYTVKREEYNFDSYIDYIFSKLKQLFSIDKILPTRNDIEENKNNIIAGKSVIVDFDINVPFNNDQKLFDMYLDDTKIDLTENEKFMEFFINDDNTIDDRRRILLKRMIMGLVSYYPIDRSSIKNMPSIVEPVKTEQYNNYSISNDINIEMCPMSSSQFIKYEVVWKSQKEKAIKMSKKAIYDDDTFDYHIRTRQACNMVYDNDKFRTVKSDESNKNMIVKMKQDEYNNLQKNNRLSYDGGLKFLSPKFYKLIKNINKYIKDGKSTGKILFYSEFRSDAGSEIFEQVLISNGYTKYDYTNTDDKYDGLRYTFITGMESDLERKNNKEAFNDIDNLYGNKIQIMIISSAGAEGISLTAVRQVHILEPYWNFVRINQVFGRAIRLGSHNDLPESKRNVEQYLYLSVFPDGNNIKDIFLSMSKLDTWNTPDINVNNDLVNFLYTNHNELYGQIQKIVKIKSDTMYRTVDQVIFDIMETKYNISQEIINVIKEASIDCIQNSRDNIILNENCIRFDKSIQDEDAFFPGINDSNLNSIDERQLESKIKKITDNIYLIPGKEDDNDVFIYYEVKNNKKIDIRYIRETGIILGILDPSSMIYYNYITNRNYLKDKLGKIFSPIQEIYRLSEKEINDVSESKYINPNKYNDLIGYKVKHNVSDKLMYYNNDDRLITRLYDFDMLLQNGFDISVVTPIIFNDNKLYKLDKT
uniref:Helicase C-terminal domain-containing protein n=1 Tax=viral metagenome TaxID=1070528 RepID=A0A6C0CYE9_9ZZZZ